MNFNLYQNMSKRTIPDKLNKQEMIGHALLGINSEAGEIAGIYQKEYQGHRLVKSKVKKEVGDLLWFIAELCTANGWNMEDIAVANIEKLRMRYPDGFSEERSVNRAMYEGGSYAD